MTIATVRRVTACTIGMLLLSAGIAWAHDLFIKPSTFFASENSLVLVRVLNGTFSSSENSIARNRLADVSVVSSAGRFHLIPSRWNDTGDTSTFELQTLGAGTYLLGVSTTPSVIALKAADFNKYLEEDGIPDVLAARRRDGRLGQDARERYQKHVKSLVQVGAARSSHFGTVLGYPAEIVPLANPYELRPGATLQVRTLVDGQPVSRQLVTYGGRTISGGRIERRSVRTDSAGVARLRLAPAGEWYVEFIHMVPVSGDTVDFESKWATLTFAIR